MYNEIGTPLKFKFEPKNKVFPYSYWMAFDVDDTLLIWEQGAHYRLNDAHLEELKKAKKRGQGTIVWTAGGAVWLNAVKAIFQRLDIDKYIDMYMVKPGTCFDDKPFNDWSSISYRKEEV